MIELFTSFTDITYIDDIHKYIRNGEYYSSGTAVVEHYVNEFDEAYHSQRSAIKQGKTQEEVLAEWKKKNLNSTIRGSAIHNFLENAIFKKIMQSDLDDTTRNICFEVVKSIYDDGLVPVRAEMVVYNDEFKVCGMMDLLAYDTVNNHFVVIDWKTNAGKDLSPTAYTFNKNMKFPLMQLPDNKFHNYSLQVSLYAWMLEMVGIKIGEMRLYHIDTAGWNMYKAIDLRSSIRSVLKHFTSTKTK